MGEIFKKAIHSKFDKEIEIPDINLENINKALKELHGITDEMLNPFDSAFDKIVKDIRDRKDNAMAMEFTKCIGELLKKNGVVPKLTEYTRNFETDNTFETRYGVSIDELDFTEHDKAFKDKIAKLEKQIDRLNEEKSFLRTRCMPCVEKDFDNRLYGKLAIVSCNEEFVDIRKYADGDDLYSIEVRNLISEGGIKRLIGQYRNLSSRLDKMSAENKELKQRIAELESFITQAEQDSTSLIFDLQQRIVELENESDNCGNAILSEIDTSNPLACAESLIEHTTHCEKFMIMPERDV